MGAFESTQPLQGYKFRVSFTPALSGLGEVAGFSRVSGLEEESEVVEYREGTDPSQVRKLVGLTSNPALVLERALSINTALRDWRREVHEAQKGRDLSGVGLPDRAFRREVTIEVVDKSGQVKATWTAHDAWPSKYTIGDLDASTSDVVMETLELAHEGLTRGLPVLGPMPR